MRAAILQHTIWFLVFVVSGSLKAARSLVRCVVRARAAVETEDALAWTACVAQNARGMRGGKGHGRWKGGAWQRGKGVHEVGNKNMLPVDGRWTIVQVEIRNIRYGSRIAGVAAVSDIGGGQRFRPGIGELRIQSLDARPVKGLESIVIGACFPLPVLNLTEAGRESFRVAVIKRKFQAVRGQDRVCVLVLQNITSAIPHIGEFQLAIAVDFAFNRHVPLPGSWRAIARVESPAWRS